MVIRASFAERGLPIGSAVETICRGVDSRQAKLLQKLYRALMDHIAFEQFA
jgi:hypothetical protein